MHFFLFHFVLSRSTQNEIIWSVNFILRQFLSNSQNEIIISFCADSRHAFFYISVDVMMSVLNDSHFAYVMIDDIIVQLFRFLINMVEISEVFIKINTGRSISPVYQFCRLVFSSLQRKQIKK